MWSSTSATLPKSPTIPCVMEEKPSTRIRWDDDELSRLAAAMAPRLLAEPGLHPLEAVRAAQACLAPERRRELKAWSLVEPRLQPKLEEVSR